MNRICYYLPLFLKSCGFIFLFIGLTGLIVPIQKNERIEVLKKQIQQNKGSHTEFVLYRDSSNGKPIYPSGILVQNTPPTHAEINAAAYLNVPIVFINHEKYKNIPNQAQLKEEHKE